MHSRLARNKYQWYKTQTHIHHQSHWIFMSQVARYWFLCFNNSCILFTTRWDSIHTLTGRCADFQGISWMHVYIYIYIRSISPNILVSCFLWMCSYITSGFCWYLWVKGSTLSGRIPDSKVYGANMGPTWVLSAPGGPHVGHMDVAIWDPVNIQEGPCELGIHSY